MAIQVLWIRADRALLAQQYPDALYYFDLITELEPQLLKAADYFGTEIGFNVSEDYADPETKGGLGLKAWRIYTRAIRNNPGVSEALTLRGRFVMLRIARDPAMGRVFVRETGKTPLEAAQEDFADAVSLNSEDLEALDGFALSSRERGLELFLEWFTGGDPALGDRAADLFRSSIDAYTRLIAVYRARRASPDVVPTTARDLAKRLLAIVEAPGDRRGALYGALYDDLGRPPGWPEPR